MSTRKRPGDTRDRILRIAGDLFARQGYTGTSIADIAGELGTTPAALYYHFRSKAEILDALVAEPLAAYVRLAEHARQSTPDELLAAFLDFTVETRALLPIVNSDPAVRVLIDERLPRTPAETFGAIVTALAGPRASRAARLRAQAAFAVVKETTVAALGPGDELKASDRKEILAAARRALHP